MRTFIRARRQFLAKAKHNVEWSAQLVMSCVVNEGPLRASVLSEIIESDPGRTVIAHPSRLSILSGRPASPKNTGWR